MTDRFNLSEARAHLSKDAVLKKVIENTTLPNRDSVDDVYLGLIRSIVSQQLSVKAAQTIYNRFLNLFAAAYPEPSLLLGLDQQLLREVGLSKQKSVYVKNVAYFFTERQLFDYSWNHHSDDEIIKLLTQIKGVGKWTVQMILIFVLSRPDVFPVLDLGIQQGIKQLYGLRTEKKELLTEMESMSAVWRPYRSIACLYFWAAKDQM